jgi:hypothetical protein
LLIEGVAIAKVVMLGFARDRGRALEENTARADEFAAAHDQNSAATWRRIANAVVQLDNKTPPGPVQ